MQPDPGQHPSNGQLLFVDTEEALSEREQTYLEILGLIMREYEEFLRQNNPIAQAYGMMKEEIEQQAEIAYQNGKEPKKLKLMFSLKKGYDSRQYNIPTSDEVAAVFVSNVDGEIPPANIVVHEREKEVTHLKVFDPMVEPMLYPLFYLSGMSTLKMKITKKITMRDYAGYKLAIRPGDSGNIVHFGRKLFQQWVVDQYAWIEWDRLLYLQLNQNKIKAASYKGLDDHLQGFSSFQGNQQH